MAPRSTIYIGLDGADEKYTLYNVMEERLSEDLDAFNMAWSRGAWQGLHEDSWRVDVIHSQEVDTTIEDVEDLAEDLEDELNQDVILHVVDKVEIR